jgi:hypothetical protein
MQGLGRHQRLARGHRLADAPRGQQRLGPLFEGAGPQTGEAGDLGLDIGVVQLAEGPAPPECECCVELGEPS